MFHPNTSVLTDNGFMPINAIQANNLIATFDPATRNLIGYSSLGKSESVENQDALLHCTGIDLRVTPEHTIFMSPSSNDIARRQPSFACYAANEIIRGKFRWQTAFRLSICGSHAPGTHYQAPFGFPERDFARLAGFFAGDGRSRKGNILEFHLTKERKHNYLSQICQALGIDVPARSRRRMRSRMPLADR